MPRFFDTLRTAEFSRLDNTRQVYLDYTGGGLYAESQIRAHHDLLTNTVLGNPHSINPTSLASTQNVELARARILRFFNANPEDYSVIFTLNASGALKLVGESYPFVPGGRYVLTADNHNSVNGIREFARSKGAEVRYLQLDHTLHVQNIASLLGGADPARNNLFAYPAQSNFSGVKHPLDWIEVAHSKGYDVLLDAAAFVPTNRLDLSAVLPDYVSISFYKMFGYPTGVGALIVRQDAMRKLVRPWFGGGTVRFVSAQNQEHLLHLTGEAFEDGTLNYLDIAAVPAGLDFLDRVGMEHLNRHVMTLTGSLLKMLGALKHSSGSPMVQIYGPPSLDERGGTVSFNLIDPQGKEVSFKLVEEEATRRNMSVRSGCFCNPGAAEAAFNYAKLEAYQCFDSLSPEEFTLQQFSLCMNNKPVGAVRVSVGIATNENDLQQLIAVLNVFRDRQAPASTRSPLEFVGD